MAHTIGSQPLSVQARLLAAMESLPYGFILFDADDRLVFCNRSFTFLFADLADMLQPGRPFEELLKAAVARGIYAGSPEEIEACVHFRLARHRDPRGPFEQYLIGGRCLQAHERRLPDGSTIGIWTDITDLRRHEDALATILGSRPWESSFLQSAARALSIGLGCRWAGIGELLPGERQIRLLAHWSGDAPGPLLTYELTGTPCAIVYREQKYCFFPDGVADLFPEDGFLRETGVVSYHGAAFVDEAGQRIGHVFAMDDKPATRSDRGERLTQLIANWVGMELQRRRAEHALREAKEAAEQASRAKGEFLANMSHEFRTPLNAIIGFSEVMRSEMLGPLGTPQYREYAGHISESGDHLLALINDILDVSKAAADKLKLVEVPVDYAALVASCLHLMESSARAAGVELSSDLPHVLPRLLADERRMRQILLNLLSNAVKFTPAGGRVSVAAAADPDRGFVVTVMDTGVGIPAKDIDRIMQPFAQVDSSFSRRSEGAGLGLPLTKALVELHDGTIRIDSKVGVGTTVTVAFPVRRMLRGTPAADPVPDAVNE